MKIKNVTRGNWKLEENPEKEGQYSLSNKIVAIHFKYDNEISSIYLLPNYKELNKISEVVEEFKNMEIGGSIQLTTDLFTVDCNRIDEKMFSFTFNFTDGFSFTIKGSLGKSGIYFIQNTLGFNKDKIVNFITSFTNYNLINSFSNFIIK